MLVNLKTYYLFVFLLFIVTAGCEESIDVELPVSETRLVIDALIGYNENNGDPITIGQVKLTLTAPFLTQDIPPATNAEVELINTISGEVFPLFEREPGIFRDGFPNLDFDTPYTLRVVYNGEMYTATEQLVKTGNIINVEQGDGFLFDENEETEIKVNFADVPNERNHYLKYLIHRLHKK